MLTVTNLVGFGAGGVLPFSFSFLEDNYTTSSGSSETFSSTDLGVAVSDRLIIATVAYRDGAETITLGSVTIGGVTATIHQEVDSIVGESAATALVSALVPSGATGDIVVSFSSGTPGSGVHVASYRLSGYSSATPHDSAIVRNASDTTPSVTVDVPEGGVCVSMAGTRDDSETPTMSGVTLRAIQIHTEQFQICYGDASEMSLETGRSIGADFGGTSNGQTSLVAGTWI